MNINYLINKMLEKMDKIDTLSEVNRLDKKK